MKKALIISAIALVLAGSVIAGVLIFLGGKESSPVENTLREVFPALSYLGEITEEGGRLDLSADISSDISKTIKGKPLEVDISIIGNDKESSVLGTLGSGDDRFDILYYATPDEISIYSERFYDGGFKVSKDTLMEDLEGSVFAPDSGSKYALDAETFEEIKKGIEQLSDSAKGEELISKAIENIIKKTEDSFDVKAKKETVEVKGSSFKADMVEISADGKTLFALAEAIRDEWNENTELREYLEENLTVNASGKPLDIEESLDELVDKTRDIAKDNDLSITMRLAVKGEYMVAFSVEGELFVDKTPVRFELSVDFSEDPSKTPDMDARLSVTLDGEELISSYFSIENGMLGEEKLIEIDAEFVMNVKNGVNTVHSGFSIETDTTVSSAGDYSFGGTVFGISGIGELKGESYVKLLSAEMKGNTRIENDGFSVSLNKIVVHSYQRDIPIEELALDSSVFELRGCKGKFDAVRPDENKLTPFFEITEAELDGLAETLSENFQKGADSINSTIGYNVFEKAPELEFLGYVDEKANSGYLFYAVDRQTKRLFVYSDKKIRAYDAITLEPLGSIDVYEIISAMDADGGRLVFAYDSPSDPYIYVYNAETLKKESSVYLRKDTGEHIIDEISSLFVRGDKVFFYDGIWTYVADLSTNDFVQAINEEEPWNTIVSFPLIAMDRENGKVFLAETRAYTCSLHVLDLETNQLRMVVKNIGSDLSSHDVSFTGSLVRVKRSYYDAEGNRLKTSAFFKENGLDKVVFKDDGFQLSIEGVNINGSNIYNYYIYNSDGVGDMAPLGVDGVTNVMRTGEDTFIFFSGSAGEATFTAWRLGDYYRMSLD